ncbi:MAG: glycyl-radical enzyme activating protein [Proteobacteria bacterium]|nr:glycyl-radical enzyme activating protein [Pseudomonadota bacterium]
MNSKELEKNGKGLVFNIQKFSLHDGPGIRTTIFMKGCPLSCKWCSNPESINRYQEIMTNDIRCIGCGKCEQACPREAIVFTETGREINWSECDLCLECADVCPSKAIDCVGDYMSVDEVLKKVEDDRIFYKNSGGGMTVSGGEALVQWEFVRELFERCREAGIHTALDTTGLAPWTEIERVIEYADLVLQDIKHMDEKKHKEGTGVDNELILSNAVKIASRKRTWFRIPLIPGFNDSEENLGKFAEFALKAGVEKVSVLAYHELGSSKYPKMGLTYGLEGLAAPDEEQVKRAAEKIESFGLKVDVGR